MRLSITFFTVFSRFSSVENVLTFHCDDVRVDWEQLALARALSSAKEAGRSLSTSLADFAVFSASNISSFHRTGPECAFESACKLTQTTLCLKASLAAHVDNRVILLLPDSSQRLDVQSPPKLAQYL